MKKALVVEGIGSIRDLYKIDLEEAGFEVATASGLPDGIRALDRELDREYDFFLVGLSQHGGTNTAMLHEISGRYGIENLQSPETGPYVWVVPREGESFDFHLERELMRLGASKIIEKPDPLPKLAEATSLNY